MQDPSDEVVLTVRVQSEYFCHIHICISYRFQDEVARIGQIIRDDDAKRNYKYPYLNPREIPNAIST